jgi:LysR family hydrogen peroxide-inducible transcriptional activator
MENRPSVRQLEAAVALADALHFGRAARACAVTQPALSAQIRALEERLRLRLFERSRRGVRPTQAGAGVIERARALLRGLDELVQAAEAAREPLSGALHLGVIPTVAPYLLPRWLPRVRAAWPRLRLFLHEDRTLRLVAALVEGGLDLLLLALPLERPDVETFPIFAEPFLLATPPGHPLGRSRTPLGEDALAHHPVLLLEDGHCLRDQALAVCQAAGAREAEGVRAASLATLVQMVAGGLGVTLLPASAAAEEARGRAVALRPFRPPAPSRVIGLAWRRSSPRGGEFRELGAFLRRLARERRGGAVRRGGARAAG